MNRRTAAAFRAQARLPQAWLQALERYYADRVLPVDLETSHTCGELTAAAQRAGKVVPTSDGLIVRHSL